MHPGVSLRELAAADADAERAAFGEYHAMGAPSAAFLLRKGPYALHYYIGYAPELYDVATDPDQTHDLAADPGHADVPADLTAELARVLDPESPDAVDTRVKRDQAALVDRFGGPEAATAVGTPGETPPPNLVNSPHA